MFAHLQATEEGAIKTEMDYLPPTYLQSNKELSTLCNTLTGTM